MPEMSKAHRIAPEPFGIFHPVYPHVRYAAHMMLGRIWARLIRKESAPNPALDYGEAAALIHSMRRKLPY